MVRDEIWRVAAVAVGVANVYRAPEEDAEVVTQALLHMPAQVIETLGCWAHIRLPDYEGWISADQLGEPAPATGHVAVVTAPVTPLLHTADRGDTCGAVFATTVLPLLDGADTGADAGADAGSGRIQVVLANGHDAWIAREAVAIRPAEQPFPAQGPTGMLALAHAFARLAVPYLWGGVTVLGADCSGFAQLCCRHAGAIIPRDADQQYAGMAYIVERTAQRAGDLVFFAKNGAIDHVGIALDGWRVLHASGGARRVTINSMNPTEVDYSARLADYYAGARRPFPLWEGGSDEQA
ncbi:MAG: C40 family peptidase [Ktedonobacterales bacterium]